MGRKKKVQTVLEGLLIEKAVAEGKCMAHHGERVVFVEGMVAPGDKADVRIIKKKSAYWIGQAIHIEPSSPLRQAPFCKHFGTCGGCKWQHMRYEAQTELKEQQVKDAFERIAKVPVKQWEPILAAEQTTYYRNKLDFAFSNRRWLTGEEVASGDDLDRHALGFHVPKRYDRVVDIEHCYLQPEPSNAIRLAVKAFALEAGIPFYDTVLHEGILRSLIIRTANTGEVMVVIVYAGGTEGKTAASRVAAFIQERFPAVTSLYLMHNPKQNDNYYDLEAELYAGKAYITEQMEDLRFRIGPKSFFQTNSAQAYRLYSIARHWAALTGNELVYDLYTGTGSIANFVARKAKKVVGIEYVKEAIDDAWQNARDNGIDNVYFEAGDMKDVLTDDFIERHGRPEVIITDPPRAGMHPDVVQLIARVAPRRIVYVSCNPATQARDIALLAPFYEVERVQPVDMFPHTHHVESVALLHRK
ncbi:MAG: 23S rRNA (uracil-5-)-methyltransferase RumA [Thermonema sp.]|uniref:23S rRNA (uracil(1939)-C(5))-methyltransferase RlmD n=1 Tax=Thermonema sp. TaxID=2231181 RepID=UPI0021DEF475|nr:23S rRNA (uracil(1939)-C(5))-methyltransferase RlmD [Thermonema sp.]GIV39767.1 MAG: 23S rRNA (uracil-5-)-methyltransferase RumA [Thermonema sp.]